MGGPGSGTWYRWDKRTTAEEVKRIDIRFMKKHGYLSSGRRSMSWSSGGESSGSIQYIIYSDCMILDYKFRRSGGDWEQVKQTINFNETACNYGNTRKWFLCPNCNKRIAVLYGVDKLFLCRHCYNLPYGSQGETYLDRMVRKSNKISAKLWEDEDGYLVKPKGMHWRTYNNLIRDFESADNQANHAMLVRFGHWL